MDQPHPMRPPHQISAAPASLSVTALGAIPLIHAGDDLGECILSALQRMGEKLADGDILVLAQKIVSKAEDRIVDLATVEPSDEARELANAVDKDARLVEVILSESSEVVRHGKGVLVVKHHSGAVLANAGIDRSNVEHGDDPENTRVLLLPEDPDRSCAVLRENFYRRARVNIGVIINDSLGRPWRNGTAGAAIGAAGITALLDLNGQPDLFDRPLQSTQIGLADELAAAASLVMGQADEGRPVVLIRGLASALGDGCARDLVRPRDQDLFR